MSRYIVRRVLGVIPRLFLISLLLFCVIHLPPGGPADIYAANPTASPEDIARIEELWGLDEPLYMQYGRWLGNVLAGDWGMSFSERRPVLEMVLGRLPNTLVLTGSVLAFSLVVGFFLGTLGATSRRPSVRYAIQVLTVLGISVPTFWSGTLVILLFSVVLEWIPTGGVATIGAPFSLPDRLRHLLAPTVVLGSVYVAQWARYLVAGLSGVLREDYIQTARSKGLTGRLALLRHALPNAAIPLITVIALEVPRLVSGAMVTEVVFSWPGVGRLLTDALLSRDYPVVMGALMMLAIAVVVANLLADVAYGLIDPRVRYE